MRNKENDLSVGKFESLFSDYDTPGGIHDNLFDDEAIGDSPDRFCEAHDKDLQYNLGEEMEPETEEFGTYSAREMYYREVSKFPLLSREQELEVAQKAQNGDHEAKNKLVQHNLRLVGYVVKKYVNFGVEYDDLIGEGNLGLIQAAEKFDYRKGFKFSTYAVWWIRKAVVKCIADQGYPLPIPEKGHMDIPVIKKAIEKYAEENGDKTPSLQELSEMTGESPERIHDLLRATITPLSIHAESKKKDGSTIGDIIPDINSPDPMAMAERTGMFDTIRSALRVLTPKERHIIELRFGLIDGQQRHLEEIGSEFGMTRERVRQIEKRAKKKILESAFGASMQEWASET